MVQYMEDCKELTQSIDRALLQLHLPLPNNGVSSTIQHIDRLNVESISVLDVVN